MYQFKNQTVSPLSSPFPCPDLSPSVLRIQKEGEVPRRWGLLQANGWMCCLSCSTAFWALASFKISFAIFRYVKPPDQETIVTEGRVLLTAPKRSLTVNSSASQEGQANIGKRLYCGFRWKE